MIMTTLSVVAIPLSEMTTLSAASATLSAVRNS